MTRVKKKKNSTSSYSLTFFIKTRGYDDNYLLFYDNNVHRDYLPTLYSIYIKIVYQVDK